VGTIQSNLPTDKSVKHKIYAKPILEAMRYTGTCPFRHWKHSECQNIENTGNETTQSNVLGHILHANLSAPRIRPPVSLFSGIRRWSSHGHIIQFSCVYLTACKQASNRKSFSAVFSFNWTRIIN